MNSLTISNINPQQAGLDSWVNLIAEHAKPDNVVWCDGSKREYDDMIELLVKQGTLTKLNPELRPDSYLARTHPGDVARVEERTFICSGNREDAGPTNNWVAPVEMKEKLAELFAGAMQGHTMYVIPFSMGPIASPLARFGIEITDSPYVVVNMHLMTRVTNEVAERIRNGANWVATIHSVGAHFSLPRHSRSLVIRFWIRRQCASRQKVHVTSYWFCNGSRRRLACRAYADYAFDFSAGKEVPPIGSIPICVRKNKSRDVAAITAWLES
jgi:GTP-dependent phosphoenolpyruvate carboxykinase